MPVRKLKISPPRSTATAKPVSGASAGKTAPSKPARPATRPPANPALPGGFAVARELNQKRARDMERSRDTPFRYRMKEGETAEVVILDSVTLVDGNLPFFMWEHRWQGADGKWDNFERCIKDTGVCPLCHKLGQDGSYTMMLTVLDLRKYVDRQGQEHKVSKKLFPVKSSMIPKYERLLKRIGNLRGAKICLSRDSQKSGSTGDSIEYVDTVKESVLAKYGDLAVPCNYSKVFPPVTEEELRARYGVGAALGSEDISSGSGPSDLSTVDFGDDEDDDVL